MSFKRMRYVAPWAYLAYVCCVPHAEAFVNCWRLLSPAARSSISSFGSSTSHIHHIQVHNSGWRSEKSRGIISASARFEIRTLKQARTRRKGAFRLFPGVKLKGPQLATLSGAPEENTRHQSAFWLSIRLAFGTLLRVGLPTLLSAGLGFMYFDAISLFLCQNWLFAFTTDSASFIPNILQVLGLLFSLLAADAFLVLYQQQESIYRALFHEVSEAKSLLEQTALVCQGRPFYPRVLAYIAQYIRDDLRRLDIPPRELISMRPSKDPLEKVMFATSVGVPSVVYETVKGLRQARSVRLGACQRKFPVHGIWLLYILAALEVATFPLLGAGTIAGSGTSLEFVCRFQSALFAGLVGATVLVLRIIGELWRQCGGSFNADAALARMVAGLEAELAERTSAAQVTTGEKPEGDMTWLRST